MFRDTSERFSLLAVTSFAARVRTGFYGNGTTVKVQSVTKALAAISKTIELAGGKSPIYIEHGVYTTPIQRMVEGFRRQDPPAVAQLAVPVEVAHTAVEAGLSSSDPKEQTIGDLTCIAFYYFTKGRRIHQTQNSHKKWKESTGYMNSSVHSRKCRLLGRGRKCYSPQCTTGKALNSTFRHSQDNKSKEWQNGANRTPFLHRQIHFTNQSISSQNTSHLQQWWNSRHTTL